ncbi:MAG: hypothetical protein JNK09_06380 [Prolixibacteraceae bacterium]|nr:hypothetical protein [Prolixibacteraceae bacterium]
MKLKSLLLVIVFAMSYLVSNAQVVEKGEKILNLGVGLGTALYSGSGYTGSVPPISGALEVVIKDDLFDGNGAIGVGGYLGYAAYKWKYSGYDYGWKYSNIIVGPRGYLHYNLIEQLDTYAGVMLGYNIVSSKWYGSGSSIGDASSGGVIFSGFIGARYFFNEKVAAMAELGSGIAYLNLGVAIKL